MIDEKKLIEELQGFANSNEMIEYTTAYDVVQDCIAMVENQPKADWIPCEVSLPVPENEDGPYTANYVTLDTGDVAIGVYRTDYKVWYTRRLEGETLYTTTHNVVAWQPLPQSYKKEGETDV